MCPTLYRGGKLVRTWTDNRGHHRRRAVTEVVGHDLFEEALQFGVGVRVGDLFLLMARDLDFWERLLGPACRAVVEDGVQFNARRTRKHRGVRLQWLADIGPDGTLTFDSELDAELVVMQKGDKDLVDASDCYSFELTPPRDLGHELLVVTDEFSIWKYPKNRPPRTWIKCRRNATLFDIAWSLFRELTFWGPPDKQAAMVARLVESVRESKADPESNFSSEEFNRLRDAWRTLDQARGRQSTPHEQQRLRQPLDSAIRAARHMQPGQADPLDLLVEQELARITAAKEKRAARKAKVPLT